MSGVCTRTSHSSPPLSTTSVADHCKLARQIRNAVIPNFSGDQVFNLLLNTSQLEFLVKEVGTGPILDWIEFHSGLYLVPIHLIWI